jgi:hypothetical protein
MMVKVMLRYRHWYCCQLHVVIFFLFSDSVNFPSPPPFTRKVTGMSKAADAKKKRGRKGKDKKAPSNAD